VKVAVGLELSQNLDMILDVTNYLSANQFLSDYYLKRKELDPEFSYAEWASEIGFTNRSFLRQIVSGQRSITENTRKLLVAKLGLDELGQQYFSHLVWRANAKNDTERKHQSEALASILRLRFNRFEVKNHLDFLMSAEIPSLQVLLTYEDIDKTLVNLSRLLKAPEQKVLSWLEVLVNLKMAESYEQDDVIRWKATTQSFSIPDQPGDVAVKHYHEKSLQKAISSLDLPTHTRKFRSLLLPLNEEQFAKAWQKLNEYAVTLLKEYDGLAFEDRRLYQINVNMVPVSEAKETAQDAEV
jgi:uncharacterized protein (TIGR02147 family)